MVKGIDYIAHDPMQHMVSTLCTKLYYLRGAHAPCAPHMRFYQSISGIFVYFQGGRLPVA